MLLEHTKPIEKLQSLSIGHRLLVFSWSYPFSFLKCAKEFLTKDEADRHFSDTQKQTKWSKLIMAQIVKLIYLF
jgi:hypothetical protein